jgi:hypothetical protein
VPHRGRLQAEVEPRLRAFEEELRPGFLALAAGHQIMIQRPGQARAHRDDGSAFDAFSPLDSPAVPKHLIAEILHGVLVTQPRPASRHALASSVLGIELGGPFQRGKGGPGGWILLDEPELHLHGDVLVPDLAGWRRERMPELPDAAAFEPDVAFEP